jgi:hypothetical protein
VGGLTTRGRCCRGARSAQSRAGLEQEPRKPALSDRLRTLITSSSARAGYCHLPIFTCTSLISSGLAPM